MPKRYLALISLFVVFVTAIFFTQKKELNFSASKPQIGKISSSSEWINTEKAIEGMEDQLRRNPDKIEVKLKLAQAYMQQGRVTGQQTYFDALAFKMTNNVLKGDPQNFEALCCKATLQASAHQFAEALQTTEEAIKINPYNSYIYGVKCDALVELGKYNDAVATGDKMVSIRPDIRSYSRISYLREIVGDYTGAIEAMKLALAAGYPGLEQTEWVRVYLGYLFEITGKQNVAEMNYKQALINREFYAPALAGLARIEKAKKNYSKAIEHYKDATDAMTDYSFHHELAILYRLTNEKEKSEKEFQTALDLLLKHQHPTSEENGIGHNIDRELALVYLSMNENEKALNNARAEYERRPDNIDVNEVVAWAYYKVNNFKNAQAHILKALKTKSRNADLWYKAGLIFKANKLDELGNKYIAIAVKTNPALDTLALLQNANKNSLAAQ
jgi:tetratricopeptide (TPR) repeat protein